LARVNDITGIYSLSQIVTVDFRVVLGKHRHEQSVDNLLIIFRMKDNDTAPQ